MELQTINREGKNRKKTNTLFVLSTSQNANNRSEQKATTGHCVGNQPRNAKNRTSNDD